MIGGYKNKRQLVIALASYISGSILGPLIFFGVIGYFIDKNQGTKPMYMLIGVGIAFIMTNILLIKKARIVAKQAKESIKDVEVKKSGDSKF